MWELDHKEGWVLKNRCFRIVLEKTLESPLDFKEIKPVNPKGNQPWIFIGRTDAEAEAPILWPLDVKRRLTGKDPNAGKDWRQERGVAKDEMVGRHHWLNRHESERTPGACEGQGSLECCSPWCLRVRHYLATEQRQWSGVFASHSDARCDEGLVLPSVRTTPDNTTVQICLQSPERLFRLHRPFGLIYCCSPFPLQCENSHWWYANKWMELYSNKNLYLQKQSGGMGSNLANGLEFAKHLF